MSEIPGRNLEAIKQKNPDLVTQVLGDIRTNLRNGSIFLQLSSWEYKSQELELGPISPAELEKIKVVLALSFITKGVCLAKNKLIADCKAYIPARGSFWLHDGPILTIDDANTVNDTEITGYEYLPTSWQQRDRIQILADFINNADPNFVSIYALSGFRRMN